MPVSLDISCNEILQFFSVSFFIINSLILSVDTISLAYWDAFVSNDWGPISSAMPLQNHEFYLVERVLIENEYSFAEYMTGSTHLKDIWIRESASNSIELYNDYDSIYGGPAIGWYPTFDKFENMPFVELYEIDTINYTVKTRGYFYHFIGQYNQQELPNLEINSVHFLILAPDNKYYVAFQL